ncbi:MAG: DUF417 family protein [Fimbriimonadaceae bacterium]|nr:DUF417 family protein [Fimbriimonadaceae bacterium]
MNLGLILLWVGRFFVILLLFAFGLAKFTAFEAEAIRPLTESSPVFAWATRLMPASVVAGGIGVVQLATASLIALRFASPGAGFVGSLLGITTFTITLSFLFTTPQAMTWADGPPKFSDMGNFLLKDFALWGICMASAIESRRAMTLRAATLDPLPSGDTPA